jgi:cytochrome c-type biogenesis protein NrfE
LSLTLSGLVLIAFLTLTLSFTRDDFSVLYVAQHSYRQLPIGLKIAAVWGGHEGSLLLWLLALVLYAGGFALRYHLHNPRQTLASLGIMAVISAALLAFIIFYSNPFIRLFPAAIEGRDLNPMLQHLGLILHPPLLYLGYAGLSVTLSLILSALLTDTFDQQTAIRCRNWAVPAWGWLTAGIILGSWWAYQELGWGGWWFWDPVENALLLPWLTSCALLHSLRATAQQGSFHHWSLLLAIFSFILSLLGTLLVRSGLILSVHAFALDEFRAVPLLSLFCILSLFALLIYALRGNQIISNAGNRWVLTTLSLFSAVTLVVLLGTLYPMLYELLGWGRISVGAPYFNTVLLPFGILMILVVIGVAWFTRCRPLKQSFPMHLAHIGVLLSALGIAFSATQRSEISLNLSQGEQVTLAGYQFQFKQLTLFAKDNYSAEQAAINVSRHGQLIAQLYPERRVYAARNQLMSEPGIHWDWMHDWYVVMGEKNGPQRYAMRFTIQSGLRWIWFGGVLMIAGAVLSCRRWGMKYA